MAKGRDYWNRSRTVEVHGLTEAKAALARLPDAFKEVMAETIGAGAGIIFDESQARVPVDEGDLKASGGVNIRSDGLQVAVGYGVHYAPFVEFGTNDTRAQPFLWPAFRIGARYIRRQMRTWAEEAGVRIRTRTKRSRFSRNLSKFAAGRE